MTELLAWIARAVGARAARQRERIQALWGGHGEVFRVELDGGPDPTAIVKWARPRGDERDVSVARKRRSFAVEIAFYREVARHCDDSCRVPRLLAAREDGDASVLVLEDLDAAGFDARADDASADELATAITWLASFHARFFGVTTRGLWPVGTYWHLATRRDELAAIEDTALRAAAERIDARLAAARHVTLLHGDAKEANFCFTRDRTQAAAVDFQYTGSGTPMRDVAYLLYGHADEQAGLAMYFRALRAARADLDGDAVEAECRALYPLAVLDFCRFLAGWRPAAWRRDQRGQRLVRALLGS